MWKAGNQACANHGRAGRPEEASRSYSQSSRRSSGSARLKPDSCSARAIHHHLPFWWDIGAISVFSLIVFYYAVNSHLGPARVSENAAEAIADAHVEDLELEIPEAV